MRGRGGRRRGPGASGRCRPPTCPPPLRRIAGFTPAKRAQARGRALLAELASAAAFRAAVMAWWDEHRPGRVVADRPPTRSRRGRRRPHRRPGRRRCGVRPPRGASRSARSRPSATRAVAKVDKLTAELERLPGELTRPGPGPARRPRTARPSSCSCAGACPSRASACGGPRTRRAGPRPPEQTAGDLRARSRTCGASAPATARRAAGPRRERGGPTAELESAPPRRPRGPPGRRDPPRAAGRHARGRRRRGCAASSPCAPATRGGPAARRPGRARRRAAPGPGHRPRRSTPCWPCPSCTSSSTATTSARPATRSLPLADQRNRLITPLARSPRARGVEITVVFDGAGVIGVPTRLGARGAGAVQRAGRARRRRHPLDRRRRAARPPGRGRHLRPRRGRLRARRGAYAVPSSVLLDRLARI